MALKKKAKKIEEKKVEVKKEEEVEKKEIEEISLPAITEQKPRARHPQKNARWAEERARLAALERCK